jgi:hypothetical protein
LSVSARQLRRIAGIAQLLEFDAFHHATGVNVQACDDPLG